jgi:hypothetical protein
MTGFGGFRGLSAAPSVPPPAQCSAAGSVSPGHCGISAGGRGQFRACITALHRRGQLSGGPTPEFGMALA